MADDIILRMEASTKKKFKGRFLSKNKIVNISKLPHLQLIYYSIVTNVIVILGVLLLKKYIPPEIPLYYGLPEGNNQIATAEELIIPSMAALVIILINISIASVIQNEYLKRALIIVSLVITLLSLITTLEIVFLVGSFT